MRNPYLDCQQITAECTIQNTTYGYYPDLTSNLIFVAIFATLGFLQLGLGFYYKSWVFTAAIAIGCFGEALGYVGRALMHSNPYSSAAFEIQICTLITCPAFFAAGVYFTLRHVVLAVEPKLSLIPAKRYTWIFIAGDCLSLTLQAVGGATAATAKANFSQLTAGSNIMLAGVILQVVTSLVFVICVGQYSWNVYQHRAELGASSHRILRGSRFKIFVAAIAVAFTTIFTRCLYRIAEMAGGWGNPIMRVEAEFMTLEGGMCIIAAFCLTVFHPGHFFPSMAQGSRSPKNASETNSDVDDKGPSA